MNFGIIKNILLFLLTLTIITVLQTGDTYSQDCGCQTDASCVAPVPGNPGCPSSIEICHDDGVISPNPNSYTGNNGHFDSCIWSTSPTESWDDTIVVGETTCNLYVNYRNDGSNHIGDYLIGGNRDDGMCGLPEECEDSGDCDFEEGAIDEECNEADCVNDECEYTPINDAEGCTNEVAECDGICANGACICPDPEDEIDCADLVQTDVALYQLTAPYDLRDRKSFIQVSNDSLFNETIHIQIFQHDRDCDELNFFDELTPLDTVIYNLDNLVRNNGSSVPANLLDDSYGYVVVTSDLDGDRNTITDIGSSVLIGNFRIIDDSGYEYRSNMAGPPPDTCVFSGATDIIAHFNTVDEAEFADVIGYAYEGRFRTTVSNIDNGFRFDIFTFDFDEEPISCDRRTFACGNRMNYGVNEGYQASRGDDLLCPGVSLADPRGGYINFENATNRDGSPAGSDADIEDIFYGWIGLNNGDNTGSMDTWIFETSETVVVE